VSGSTPPSGTRGVDPYARCRDCGSRDVEGIADAHAVGRVGRLGTLVAVTRFEESFALVDRGSLMCADCGSWNVRAPEALR
jgi:hypothetical protein